MNDKEIDEIWKPVKSVIDHYRMNYDAAVTLGGQFGKLIEEIKRLREENQNYKQALEFYAKPENYEPLRDEDKDRTDAFNHVDLDQGQTARQVLKK